jgi:hypothetical protein
MELVFFIPLLSKNAIFGQLKTLTLVGPGVAFLGFVDSRDYKLTYLTM